MQKELWKVIEDYPDYAVSNLGRVRRITPHGCMTKNPNTYPGKIIAIILGPDGYRRLYLYKKGESYVKKVARLVAVAFLGPIPKGKEVHHKDGKKENDISENLEYVTRSENIRYAFKLRGRRGKSKLCEEHVREIRSLAGKFLQREIAELFEITQVSVSEIILRKTWDDVL